MTGSIRYAEENGNYVDAKEPEAELYRLLQAYNLRFNEQLVDKDKAFFDNTAQAQTDAFFSSSDQSKPGIYSRVLLQ